MDFEQNIFEIEYTEQCIEEMEEIYEYISKKLKNNSAAIRLIEMVYEKVLNLAKSPDLYMKIGKADKLKRDYHRIVIKNYVILYTVDYQNKKVFVSRMIYGKRKYLN